MASPCNLHVYPTAILLLSFHTHTPLLSLSLSLHSRLSRDSCLLCNLLQAGFLVRLTNTRPHETFSPFPRFFLVLFLLKKKRRRRSRISARNSTRHFLKLGSSFVRKSGRGKVFDKTLQIDTLPRLQYSTFLGLFVVRHDK